MRRQSNKPPQGRRGVKNKMLTRGKEKNEYLIKDNSGNVIGGFVYIHRPKFFKFRGLLNSVFLSYKNKKAKQNV